MLNTENRRRPIYRFRKQKIAPRHRSAGNEGAATACAVAKQKIFDNYTALRTSRMFRRFRRFRRFRPSTVSITQNASKNRDLYQGTTSVVPQVAERRRRALAPAKPAFEFCSGSQYSENNHRNVRGPRGIRHVRREVACWRSD
jgi:hypothetical protein